MVVLFAMACSQSTIEHKVASSMTLDSLAQEYVKLTLQVGQHHTSYIDAYYGPEDWRPKGEALPLTALVEQVQYLITAIKTVDIKEDEQQRYQFLSLQLTSVLHFIYLQQGKEITFDQESLALYDAVSPDIPFEDLDRVLVKLNNLLPGGTPLNQRLNAFNSQFEIPKNKLDQVFVAAISEARKRTKQYIALPENENFTIEYVTDKIWSGYNWYKGNNFSVIQLNTDFPIYINRAIDLASHEGYPGHHVFNSQMEQHLVNQNNWIEYSVYPLFSPMSLLAEGSANYGIEVAFPHAERMTFEREVLFPLAGLDPALVEKYYQVQALLEELSYTDNIVAKNYLDGNINKEQAIELLMTYALTSKEKSAQRIGFIEANRAYVINYNLGQDLVKAYVEQHAADSIEQRWKIFSQLLAFPKTASMMLN